MKSYSWTGPDRRHRTKTVVQALALLLLIFVWSAPVFSADAVVDIHVNADVPVNPDPYETFNRDVFKFNEAIDRFFLKPAATLYVRIVPRPLVTGIHNFFDNIEMVPTTINDLLQGNIYQTVEDVWRLGLNTTIGLLGFFDPATLVGLSHNNEDLGLTLARWGYVKSTFLMIPFWGPSTVRDAPAKLVNYYLFSVYPWIQPVATQYEVYGVGVISRRAELFSYENVMEQAAVDRYVFVRDAYMQHRAWLINRNKELGDPYLEKKTDLANKPAPASFKPG